MGIVVARYPREIEGAIVLLLGNGPSAWRKGFVPSRAVERLRARGTRVLVATCNGGWRHLTPDLAFAADEEQAKLAMLSHVHERSRLIIVERYAELAQLPPPASGEGNGWYPLPDFALNASTGHGAAWYLAHLGAAHVILAGFDGPHSTETLFQTEYDATADRSIYRHWARWLLVDGKSFAAAWPKWTLVLASEEAHPLDELPAPRVAPWQLESYLAAVGGEPWPSSSCRTNSRASPGFRGASATASPAPASRSST